MAKRARRDSSANSFDTAFRAIVRREVEAQLQPIQSTLSRLEAGASELSAIRRLADQLVPLASLLGGRGSPGLVRRGPGRPKGSGKGKGGRRNGLARERGCAIIGCRRPSRTKGYCAAHYQKLRMLSRTGRRPSEWADFASPASVADVILPRGRAAHKSRSPRQEA